MVKIRGFTLTEVLIVVVVLAILAALVLPRFSSQDERGFIAEATGALSAVRQAEEAYRLENPTYTNVIADLDVDISTSTNFDYTITGATAADFLITAERNGGQYNGMTITLDQSGDFGGTHPFGPEPD
jgi:prepilin-type N-terminal cleavage/methylation domain-containing protein